MFACRIEPALDTDLLDQLLEAKAAADHADRAEDRGRIAKNLVACTGDHVAAGCGDVFDEHQHRQFLFRGELPDPQIDLARLYRRPAGRIDRQRHRFGIFGTKGALQHFGDGGQRHARPQRRNRADHARQPHHRHDRDVAPQPRRHIFLQPADEARQPGAITYLFTHAVTSN